MLARKLISVGRRRWPRPWRGRKTTDTSPSRPRTSSSDGSPNGVLQRTGSTSVDPGQLVEPAAADDCQGSVAPPYLRITRTIGPGAMRQLRGGLHDVAVDHVEGRLAKLNVDRARQRVVHVRASRVGRPRLMAGSRRTSSPGADRSGEDVHVPGPLARPVGRAKAEADVLDRAGVDDRVGAERRRARRRSAAARCIGANIARVERSARAAPSRSAAPASAPPRAAPGAAARSRGAGRPPAPRRRP